MKFPIAATVLALLSTGALLPAQAQAPAKKSTKPVSVKKAPAASRRQAIEEATPTEEPDPTIKLSDAELEIAKKIYLGEVPCELGAKVTVKAMKREGFFFVSRGINHFIMHPVESRTGAIRLEDPVRGALWLQLANKSMLMNQREGKRLADECQTPEQVKFAAEAKTRPPINLLEPVLRPAAPAAAAASAAPAAPTPNSAPAAAPAASDPK